VSETDDLDPLALDRYVAGAASPAESAAVERWLAGDPNRQVVADALARARDRARRTLEPEETTVDERWARMASDAALGTTRHAAGAPVTGGTRMLALVIPAASARSLWRPRGSGAWMTGAAAAVVVAIGATLVVARTPWTDRSAGTAWTTYAAAAGERASVMLPDGTRVRLAPATTLSVPTEYAHGLRTVRLDGEAYFAVTHDAAHPFAVRAGNTVVTDVGTTFDVRAYGVDHGVRVAVAEGRVDVRRAATLSAPRAAHDALGAGDVASVSDTRIAIAHDANVAALTAWTDGHLVFRSAPVPEMLADLGRWYDLNVTLTDSSLAGQRVTATFGTEPVDSLAAELGVVLNAHVVRRGRTLTISAPAREPAGRALPSS
jgi:transmembrane sensor